MGNQRSKTRVRKVYLKQNVYEAALDRIRWLFDEFEHVIVDFSGGKDSTVIVRVAYEKACKRDPEATHAS